LAIAPEKLLESLSYSHFELIVALEDGIKRAFYEIECMRGNWSVRELKRQIGSLYYERSGLSNNKQKLAELANQSAESQEPSLNIRDPYVFEFLGLKPKEVMSESHLEDQLVLKLEAFLLELGHGFCFEARQKRILIGDEHFFHRPGVLPSNSQVPCVGGAETGALHSRKHRPAQHLCELVSTTHDERRR
jgi:predicted nuclease of restriction endonuclease-like (RecB) superfamily